MKNREDTRSKSSNGWKGQPAPTEHYLTLHFRGRW